MENPYRLHRYGTILLWAGVLVWAPYLVLRVTGNSPSLLIFLPFHLVGVIGGARMRSSANKQLGKPVGKPRRYKRLAHYIIIASILVWIPYFGLKLSGRPVEMTPFLVVHLIGVFSALGLLGIGAAVQYFQKKKQQ